ncbi:hypothetical protein C8R45DRAFT_1057183 [Mycena sanguinolenta]|nr:hypothetical protein C8R45DRAFT_1057183 [Mycena sanguinolenta]
MSSYKSFAVVGAGHIGTPILNALAAANASVILLSRPGSSKTAPAGVKIAQVDYTEASAVASVFKEHNVDVVISTVATEALDVQKVLVDAAHLAAVKLFVPSEFGIPTHGQTGIAFDHKNQITAQLKSLGNGFFTEFVKRVGYADGKFTFVGKGDTPVSFTSIPDIAGFLAHVLRTLPSSQLENRILRIQGDRASMNQIAAKFNVPIDHVDALPEEAPMVAFLTAFMKIFEAGGGSTGWDQANRREGEGEEAAGSSNKLWEGHKWRTIEDVYSL